MTVPRRFLADAAAYMVGGTDAGQPILAFYAVAAKVFSILATRTPIILGDTPAGTWGLAWFVGLTQITSGDPRFQARDDVVVNEKIAYHECTHAWEAILISLLCVKNNWTYAQGEDYVRTKYWTWRGFPGTWWDAYLDSLTKGVSGGWAFLPGESLAEAGSAAISGTVLSEWTMNYGKDLAIVGGTYSPQAGALLARDFFQTLQREVSDVALTNEEIEAVAQRVASLLSPSFSEVITKLESGFNVTVPVIADRAVAGDKKTETAEIDK